SNLSDRIENMENISETVKKDSSSKDAQLRKEEVDAIIRDFSLTRKGREVAFGTGPIDNENIEKEDDDTPKVSGKTINAWDNFGTGKLLVPENDYLNLESMIEEINPITDPRQDKNEKIVYNVNHKVLSEYINVQSLVRESVGSKV